MSGNVKFKGALVDAPEYVVNPKAKLPDWVKCHVCGKGPTGVDWLKPVNPDPNCRKLIHFSHINDGPQLSAEGGFILRNA